MGARQRLYQIIKVAKLDYRFADKWGDTLLLIQEGIYTDALCEVQIREAEQDAEEVEERGNFLDRPPEEEELYAEGKPDIELGGTIESDLRVGIRYKDRPRNVLIFGSAGSGKTVTTRRICLGIDAEDLKDKKNPTLLCIMDLKGDNQDLPHKLRGDVLPLSVNDNLRIGLNGPPDVPPHVWIGHMSLSLAARLGLVISRTCLAGVIMMLLVSLNPGLAASDLVNPTVMKDLIWPSLAMVLDALRIRKVMELYSAKAAYGQTLIQMLSGLLQDAGRLYDCSNGFDIGNELLRRKRHCVINASNTPPYIVHLVNDYFINYVLASRLFNNYKCDNTDIVFVYDEADLLVESDWETAFQNGLSPLNRLHRLGRELGLMSVVSISAPQAASEHIRRSAHTTIGFNLSDAPSVRAAVAHFQLDPRCGKFLSSLPPGQCIVRQTQASYSNAFWCQMDMVPPDRTIGRVSYPSHPYTPAVRLAASPRVLAALNAAVGESEKTEARQEPAMKSRTEELAMELLQRAADRPYLPVVRLIEEIGEIGFKDEIAMRKYLEDHKYARFEEQHIGRPKMLLIEVTGAGYQALGRPQPPEPQGRGLVAHRHFAHWIQEWFSWRGYQAVLEWIVPGTNHPADVAVQREDGWEVIEICVTATENLVSHIEACFEQSTAVAKLTVVTGTQAKLAAIKKTLSDSELYARHADRISFDVIQSYLRDGR